MTVGYTIHHSTFPSMGTEIEIVVVEETPGEGVLAARIARELAEEWEATFSRFRPDSELSLLNCRAGIATPASPRLFVAIERAVEANASTAGLFNPLVLPRLIDLGYDRTYQEVAMVGPPFAGSPPWRVPPAGRIRLDARSNTVTLPRGSAIDLGGIAKGLYVDELVSRLTAAPAGIVSAGGDMRVWGRPPGSDAWTIGLEDPANAEEELLELALASGAIATSGTNRRSWRRGTEVAHHLIDPRTGMPAESRVQSVTVLAQTAAAADVLATALFIAGAEAALESASLRSQFALAVFVIARGKTRIVEGGLDLDVSIRDILRLPAG